MKTILSIEPGQETLWETFIIQIESQLQIESGKCYHLEGANGSGKSSFIKRILIPTLSKQAIPYIYIEQQMRSQLFALMADASLRDYEQRLQSEQDAIHYLMSCLEVINMPLVCICDESSYVQEVHASLVASGKEFSMIIVSHEQLQIECDSWIMKLISPIATRLALS